MHTWFNDIELEPKEPFYERGFAIRLHSYYYKFGIIKLDVQTGTYRSEKRENGWDNDNNLTKKWVGRLTLWQFLGDRWTKRKSLDWICGNVFLHPIFCFVVLLLSCEYLDSWSLQQDAYCGCYSSSIPLFIFRLFQKLKQGQRMRDRKREREGRENKYKLPVFFFSVSCNLRAILSAIFKCSAFNTNVDPSLGDLSFVGTGDSNIDDINYQRHCCSDSWNDLRKMSSAVTYYLPSRQVQSFL